VSGLTVSVITTSKGFVDVGFTGLAFFTVGLRVLLLRVVVVDAALDGM
tara:strand:- start:7084 stop:7227 length:144 start_codon:yes stop_codon:yes gene_type:complete